MAAVAVGVVLSAPACGPAYQEVLVVGHDANGTPVVGAVDCSFDDRLAAEVVSVSEAAGSRAGPEIWRVERPGHGLGAPEVGPPAPPEPEPRFIGGVELVAIGDPQPSGGDAVVPLAEPLPDDLVVEAFTFADDLDPIDEVLLARATPPGTYDVAFVDGTVARGVDADGAAAIIDDECEDDIDFDGTAFALIVGIAGAVLLLVAIPIGLLTARQFTRAGAAHARRRAGPPTT